jgi:hypothetical protein
MSTPRNSFLTISTLFLNGQGNSLKTRRIQQRAKANRPDSAKALLEPRSGEDKKYRAPEKGIGPSLTANRGEQKSVDHLSKEYLIYNYYSTGKSCTQNASTNLHRPGRA